MKVPQNHLTEMKLLSTLEFPLSALAGVMARVEQMHTRQAESERQVENLFESLLAESFGGVA